MFKPTNNRILIRPDEKQQTTSTGIILPDSKELPVTGTVEVGDNEFKKGQRVLFSKFGYDEVTIEKKSFYIVSVTNILGIFE